MRLITCLFSVLLSATALARPTADYLPPDADLDPAIPTPESVLGWEIGEWRVSHDLLVKYMETLAAASDRISLKVIGRTHELRPLLQLAITSAARQPQLESLREQHLRDAHGNGDGSGPLVVWLGYSIHGNEESGSNSSLLMAYYLAASRSAFITDLLDHSVILLDPSFNPDGFNRFASWSNTNRSMNPVADPNHRIHNEEWPLGRTNHYLFDLNRDWLPLVHPESRARIAEYHRWLPHVLNDHHETGNDEGYFFQPGVPTRQNPLTTADNLAVTRELAEYHARAMDAAGERFFTEEGFDDFYFGKGSTYPDINGTIGILYEQPNIKGPVKDQFDRRLRFEDAISNHLRTASSTLEGAHALRNRLIRYQSGFFDAMEQRAENARFRAWIIGDGGDPARARTLLDVLDQHQVEFRALDEDVEADGRTFRAGHAWVIPARQRQFGLVQAMMQQRTEFQDETFYDVSAWTFPLAWNLPFATVSKLPATTQDARAGAGPEPPADPVAWMIPWRQMGAPALLQKLLSNGARVRAANRPLSVNTARGRVSLAEGTLMVHAGTQDTENLDTIRSLLADASRAGTVIHSGTGGLTPAGPDLGSREFKAIRPIRPMLITGPGTASYDVGEAWHHMDQRLGLAPVMVEMHRLKSTRLDHYTHLLMVDGDYGILKKSDASRIAAWVKAGGILVTSRRASNWAEDLCFASDQDKCEDSGRETGEKADVAFRAYADYPADEARLTIGGAIVSARLDLSHPLAWGYSRPELPLFRQGTVLLKPSDNAYATPVRYTGEPLLSGFIGPKRQDEIRNQPAVIAERQGKGLLVRFADNPLFRGFWRGTERLWENALYMGQAVQSTTLPY